MRLKRALERELGVKDKLAVFVLWHGLLIREAIDDMSTKDYFKIALNVLVAAAVGYSQGDISGAIIASATILAGLFQKKPGA